MCAASGLLWDIPCQKGVEITALLNNLRIICLLYSLHFFPPLFLYGMTFN
jgi:hypothetical protein